MIGGLPRRSPSPSGTPGQPPSEPSLKRKADSPLPPSTPKLRLPPSRESLPSRQPIVVGYPTSGEGQGFMQPIMFAPRYSDRIRETIRFPEPARFPVPAESPMSPTDRERLFPGKESIIHPTELKGLVPNRDYTLLVRGSEPKHFESIHNEGVKSTKELANDPNASEEIKARYSSISNKFGPDPNLIYFRPTDPNRYPVKKNEIAIAVKPDSARVFNQEKRVHGTKASYEASSMSSGKYHDLRGNLQPGEFITESGGIDRWRSPKPQALYVPEIPVRADRIEPSLFVPHDQIDPTLRRE